MLIPDYWLKRPSAPIEPSAESAFDELLQTTLREDGCPTISFTLPWPKWQFLCFLVERYELVLHGSGNANITLFEPRLAADLNDFGNQQAIYAATDGIWPMFFAVVDRERFAMSVNNACVRLRDAQGQTNGPYYVFSISNWALAQQPWRTGTVYLLPRQTFVAQPPFMLDGHEIHVAQLVSLVPVRPLAKLTITPDDFPFLTEIRGHDDARLQEYATAIGTGAPWPDDE